MAGPTPVLNDLTARLEKAAAEVEDTRGPYKLALELRNALVVECVDQGMTQSAVGKIAGFKSRGRVTSILANHGVVDLDGDQ